MKLVVHPATLRDEDLIGRVAAGDRDAFLALYDRYAPRMLGLILTVVRDRAAADDVLQKVMLEVWQRHAARFQPALGAVDSWLLRLAKSRAIDLVRSSGISRVVSLDELAPESLMESISTELPDVEREALAAAINMLPGDERVVVILAYFQGLTREEIADHSGVPVGTVKTRIRRAMGRLRELLSPAEVGS